jgi:hypothetical protein
MPPRVCFKWRSSRASDAMSGSAAIAAEGGPGGGCSFSTNRVMMPSVPSEPMNRKRGSSPALFLTRQVSESSTLPSASTTSTPSTESRIVP